MPASSERMAGPTGCKREAIGMNVCRFTVPIITKFSKHAQLKRPAGKRDPMETLLRRITKLKFVNSGVVLMNHTFS